MSAGRAWLFMCCSCVFANAVTLGLAATKRNLTFSYITTKSGGFISSGGIPVVDLALELINNRTDILPGYNLAYTTVLDSKCNAIASLDAFMTHFNNDSQPTYISTLCCGCSTAGIPVGEVSHYWNVPQMADVAGAYIFNDRQRFRGFFRTLPSFELVGPSLAEIAREFNWTQMAIITQEESLFNLVRDSLKSTFNSGNLVLDTSATIEVNADPFPYYLIHNWERDYRVIIINSNPKIAYTALCDAYYRGKMAPKYVWLIPSWYSRGWWMEDYGNASCTPSILRKMLNGTLAYTPHGYFVSEGENTVTFSGLTPEQYEEEYSKRLLWEQYQIQNLTEFGLSGSSFDATWAMALGLHIASERVSMNDSFGCDHFPGELVPLEEFHYQNARMGCLLRNSFHAVSFLGITGMIAFNRNGSRIVNSVLLQQYHVPGDGAVSKKSVADIVFSINSGSEFAYKENVTAEFLWPDGIPYDGAARERFHQNHIALTSIYSICATVGIVYCIICSVFNTIFKENRVIKPSSPHLNYLIIAGAALLYTSVYLYIISVESQQQQTYICITRHWLFSVGYDLCFAVTLAKTWRIYYIFANPAPKRKLPKDWFLFVIVVPMVAVDVLIVLIGTSVPSLRLNATVTEDRQHPMAIDADGITIIHYVFVCLNGGATVWLAISYAYKGLLQLMAMLVAFHVRRVKIKALNETKEIVVIIYINSLTLLLWIVAEFVLYSYHEVYPAVFGLALLSGATVFLTLVFVPKMAVLYSGKDITLESSSVENHTTCTQTDEVVALKRQIKELEDVINKQKDT